VILVRRAASLAALLARRPAFRPASTALVAACSAWPSEFPRPSVIMLAAWCTRRRVLHPTEGAPSVSTAAKIKPPRSPRFLRSWVCCWALLSASGSSQNRCPAYVVGAIEPIRASEARRGNFPMANRTPPPTWTIPFSLATVSGSSIRAPPSLAAGWAAGSRVLPAALGFRMAFQPSAMKIEAKRGRAIRREILTGFLYPSCREIPVMSRI
jgi:hypothetical protein